jgi:hypothetical protein
MSTRGTHVAVAIAVAIAFLLPKRVECSFPGASCGHAGRGRTLCTDYQVEPLGIYAIELPAKRDVGFAYSSGSDCR